MNFPTGTRVTARYNIDRYPHFMVPKGATGTVIDRTDGRFWFFVVKLDQPLSGCEEWDHEIYYNEGDGSSMVQDWHGAGATCPECGKVGEQPTADFMGTDHFVCRPCDVEFTVADGVTGSGLNR
jgi:hypothetical protein